MKTLVQINHKKEFSLINGISNQLKEIVILDPTIPDSHHIASGIKPGTATYILESQPDAVEQITTILAQHTEHRSRTYYLTRQFRQPLLRHNRTKQQQHRKLQPTVATVAKQFHI
jgi:hypothetical protein